MDILPFSTDSSSFDRIHQWSVSNTLLHDTIICGVTILIYADTLATANVDFAVYEVMAIALWEICVRVLIVGPPYI